jgi:AcrR family transcriptional regulator
MTREEKQVRILEAALKLFARYGYKKTTVEDIGDELDMTKGNLYLYAKNKKDLYQKTIAYALKKWQTTSLQAAAKKVDILDRIYTYAIEGYAYLSKEPNLLSIILNDPNVFPLSPKEDLYFDINLESKTLLANMLKVGVEEGRFRSIDIEHIAEFYYSVYVMLIIKTYVKKDTRMSKKEFRTILDVLFAGVLSG